MIFYFQITLIVTMNLKEVQPLCLRPWRMSWGWPQSIGRHVRSGPYQVAVPFTKKHLAVPKPYKNSLQIFTFY